MPLLEASLVVKAAQGHTTITLKPAQQRDANMVRLGFNSLMRMEIRSLCDWLLWSRDGYWQAEHSKCDAHASFPIIPVPSPRPALLACFLLSACLLKVDSAAGGENMSFLPDTGDANLTAYLDNDLFADTDEDYTNGARLSWISGSRDPEEFGPVQRFLQRLSSDPDGRTLFRRLSGFSDPQELEYNYGFSITQLMYTPEDEEPKVAPPGQRPYAGWLGIDASLFIKDSNALNTVSLAIGTTGSHSYAKQAQDLVHSIRGQQEFDGWGSQVPNEVTVNFYTSQRRRLVILDPTEGKFAIDGFIEAGLALGTFQTGASAGSLFRIGWNLPLDFADARLSITSYSHQPFKSERKEKKSWSFYGLTGFQGALVAHNITLDGPVFRSFNTGTNSEPAVGEVYVGFGMQYQRVNFSYVHTYRTKEFKGQQSNQTFGSLTLGYRL